MILQSLCDYYDSKEKDLAPFGFEEKRIPFSIVIDSSGRFIQLESNTQEIDGKSEVRSFRVPKAKGRSGAKSYETAYCLWDHYGYVLAQPKLAKPGVEPTQKDIDTAEKQHFAFKSFVAEIDQNLSDDGVRAVWTFLNEPSQVAAVKSHELWADCLRIKGCNLAFRIAGETSLVCQSPAVIKWVKEQPLSAQGEQEGLCLLTGEVANIARLHDQITGVGQKPAPLAAINDSAYCSYGKEKGFNFPVGAVSSFKYATALNHLLRKNSLTKFRVAETSYVCWAESNNDLEKTLPVFFADRIDDPEAGAVAIKQLFSSVHNGAYVKPNGSDRFHLLGLAPNSARIVVRFWQVGTVAEFSQNLARWFADLELIGQEKYGYPTLKQLLRGTALQYKDDNVSPSLPPAMVRSILTGSSLPASALQATLRRIKAEAGHVTYTRAALLKACLSRSFSKEEIKVSLNKEERRIGYCLGRLFACYEKLQQDAQPGINATIRDRYYSSASSNPVAVFGTLQRLSVHHMKKLENPAFRVVHDKRLGEVMSTIDGFPAHLNLEDQGLFGIGYYHQKQDFFTKSDS